VDCPGGEVTLIDTVFGPDVHAAGLRGPDRNEFMRLAIPFRPVSGGGPCDAVAPAAVGVVGE
jgi:hypothetical protein